MRKTRFRKFAKGSTIQSKNSEIDICTRIFILPNEQYRNSNLILYCTLGPPAKFWILYVKISHKTNKQWVRYGTMQLMRSRYADTLAARVAFLWPGW
jgi:hypothetical protein